MRGMAEDFPPLIAALLDSKRYADSVQAVECVQTHISWVLLAGEFAYKIKKPLRLAFLDFSTLAQRHQYCLEELRLNRRFAPAIYLQVVGIFNTPQDPQWSGGGPPFEYAVKMRRFDDADRLDRVCARGELQARHLSDLAATLAAFHAGAQAAPVASRFGSPQTIAAPALANFDALRGALEQADLSARLATLRAWTLAQQERLGPLLLKRKREGWVRECHGDLHLANLVLIKQRVQMFDCIEFNEDLRWIDVASEIAFTYTDLLAHAQPGLANWFLNEMLSRNGDYQAAPLLRFYGVYRALVRAKVAALRAAQVQGDPSETLAYIALAERLTTSTVLHLVITHGLSGCGKTFASDALLQRDDQPPTLRLRSDVERKRLAGLAPTASSGSALDGGIYTPDAHARTYAHLLSQADGLLRAGWSVLVDATFLRRADRTDFARLAHACGARFAILAPAATPDQLRQRILARSADARDASEATATVLAQQMQVIEPLSAAERRSIMLL